MWKVVMSIKRILFVDDEPDIKEAFRMGLENRGFKVDAFTDPFLALSDFKKNPASYDMVILDIKMPTMDGFELYRQIRRIKDKVKVIFFSATERYFEDLKNLFPAIDKRQFIRKPITIDDFVREVRAQLDLHS